MFKPRFNAGHLGIGFMAAAIMGLAIVSPIAPAFAGVTINVDKSTQRMTVSVDGVPRHVWQVSTGRAGYGTPNGSFRPQRMARMWFSRRYYNSPMPYSIFFHGGYAIHGSSEISRLGGPASHGCVRLHPSNAATLYSLVQQQGPGNTRITVTGSNPSPSMVARRATVRRDAARRRIEDAVPEAVSFRRTYRPVYVSPTYEAPAYEPFAPAAPAYAPPFGW